RTGHGSPKSIAATSTSTSGRRIKPISIPAHLLSPTHWSPSGGNRDSPGGSTLASRPFPPPLTSRGGSVDAPLTGRQPRPDEHHAQSSTGERGSAEAQARSKSQGARP